MMPIARAARAVFCLLLALMLGACAPGMVSRPETAPLEAAAGIEAAYRRAEALGQTVMRVDPQRSLIVITARRGGSLARLGHDHVLASRRVQGFAAPQSGRADLSFRLDQLTVDEAGLRLQAGLQTQPSDDAIAGTRHNMLTRVLDAERYPEVRIHATRAGAGNLLSVALTLHGVTRKLDIQVEIDDAAETDGAALTVSGSTTIRQSDFGIVPFSILGGAIAVQDLLEVHFRIVARAKPAASAQ